MTLIKELNSRLEDARKAYYAGEPLMSDPEYDVLEEELSGMVKAHPAEAADAAVLSSVGTDTSGRIAHRVPMLSLENKFTFEELCEWADCVQAALGLPQWPDFTLEPKYDGVSDSLEYEGALVQALVRGDGSAGDSVLPQIRTSSSVPAYLPEATKVNIRGEAIIAMSTLRDLNSEIEARGGEPYSNTRNLTAGTLKLQDLDEVKRRKLLFAPWEVLLPTNGLVLDSSYQRLKMIEEWGFTPYSGRVVTNREELQTALDEMLPTLQAPDQDICKDGLVFKVDSFAYRETLGRGSKFTRWQVCLKPQNQKANTEVLSVQWQVGRQGKVTPVATVAPVILGGVKIERATLNNLSWLLALGVRIGSKVALVRSGDVIPKIVEVLENGPGSSDIIPPIICPECEAPTATGADEDSEDSSVAILCKNAECPGRLREMLTYIADRTVLEIDGLGPELAKKLLEHKLVRNLPGLFQFGNELRSAVRALGQSEATLTLSERAVPVALTLRMVESLETAKTAPWDRWLAAFCIPMVGRRLGKVIARTLKLQPDDLPQLASKLASIQMGEVEGLGKGKLGEVHRYACDPKWAEMLSGLYEEGVRPASTVATLAAGKPYPSEQRTCFAS